MEYVENDIIDFICGHGGIYANPHGVSMATGINNNMLVASHIRKVQMNLYNIPVITLNS